MDHFSDGFHAIVAVEHFKKRYEVHTTTKEDEIELLLALAEKYEAGTYWRDSVQVSSVLIQITLLICNNYLFNHGAMHAYRAVVWVFQT